LFITGRSKNKTGIAVAIALPIVAAVLVISTVCLCFFFFLERFVSVSCGGGEDHQESRHHPVSFVFTILKYM